jgi:hypothetical protein
MEMQASRPGVPAQTQCGKELIDSMYGKSSLNAQH